MSDITSATASAHHSERIPQNEQKVINLVKKIQEMSHPEIKQKALEVFENRGYGENDRLDLEQAQGAISAFCFADLDIAFGDQQELLKQIEEVIKAQGGSVDLQELTECMNYAQNYKDVKTTSPSLELMKIEEVSKKSSMVSSPDISPHDKSNAHINVDQLS